MNRRLFRSPDDRVVAGVAGGMAEAYDLDPALVRVGWALLILLTGGVFLVLYIVMAVAVPLRPMGMPLWAAGGPMPSPDSAPSDPSVTPGGVPPAGSAPAPGMPYGYYRHGHRRDGGGALVVGLILIIVGGFFLLRQFMPDLNVNLFWPVIIIIGGVLLILAAFSRPRGTA